MATNKKLNKAARERMARTGEKFSTARMHILAKLGGPPTSRPTGGGVKIPPDLIEIIEPLLYDVGASLADMDEMVIGAMALTNALGFGVDTYELLAADYSDAEEIHFTVNYIFSGDHEENKPWSGSSLDASVDGIAHKVEGTWRVVEAAATEVASDF